MLYNLARMSTETTGDAATISLHGAVLSFLTFAEAGAQDNDTVTYAIEDNIHREIGYGVYNNGTLTRSVVLKSTNNDQRISLSGEATVSITAAAEDLLGPQDGGLYARKDGAWAKVLEPQQAAPSVPKQIETSSPFALYLVDAIEKLTARVEAIEKDRRR
jgi:hypothetical protein